MQMYLLIWQVGGIAVREELQAVIPSLPNSDSIRVHAVARVALLINVSFVVISS